MYYQGKIIKVGMDIHDLIAVCTIKERSGRRKKFEKRRKTRKRLEYDKIVSLQENYVDSHEPDEMK